jgi:hypothetical protein
MRRQQRGRQLDMPAPVRKRAASDASSTGYALIVDGQIKAEFNTHDRAIEMAKDLKKRLPRLQVKVFNQETKASELIDLAAA